MVSSRLICRTPTGAMLWEIWGRRKVNLAFNAAALLVSLLCVRWLQHGPGDITKAVLSLVLISCFLGAYLDLLSCFGYVEVDAKKVQIGYPSRLLLKPVSTLKLVLVPMVFGGATVVTLLLVWDKLVLQPLGHVEALNPLWLGAVILSFFWWMQALAWSFPLLPGRLLVMILVAMVHLLIGLMSLLPAGIISGWHWSILAALLMSAVFVSWIGLNQMRQGRWEGPTRMARFWSGTSSARAQGRRKKFQSAFRAQFWLEWCRHGWLLPSLSGGVVFGILPLIFFINKQVAAGGPGTDFKVISVNVMLAVPLLISAVIGTNIAQFDRLEPSGELPVYITVRPMTNGGFVMAKLAMALASSVLTWLIMLAVGGFWLVLLEAGTLISKGPATSPFVVLATVIGGGPLLLLLVLFTWKNMIGAMGIGLSGRRRLVVLFTCGKIAFMIGLGAFFLALKLDKNIKDTLLHWLTTLLILCLAIKIAMSTAAFIVGLRRHAITRGAVGWIVGGWLAAGLFMAIYAGLICCALHHFELWLWIALAGFQVLPLADLAIAPLALAWNRHR